MPDLFIAPLNLSAACKNPQRREITRVESQKEQGILID